MRTKTIYFFSLFLTITMMTGCFHISSGPKPSKSKMTKKYSVTPFNKIENKAPANIVFTQGNVTKVEADGPDNYIPQLIVMVKDSTLSISMDKDKFKNFKSSKIKYLNYQSGFMQYQAKRCRKYLSERQCESNRSFYQCRRCGEY